MNLWQAVRSGRTLNLTRASQSPWPAVTLDQLPYWFGQFGYQGLGYGPAMIQSTIQANQETIQADFVGYITGAYKTNGAIFALILTRMMVLSEARFQFRDRNHSGRPGKLFGTNALEPLETPWPNGTTGDLIARMSLDVDLAGNFYGVRLPAPKGSKLPFVIRRMRPDWVTIMLGSYEDLDVDALDPSAELIGYMYQRGGLGSGQKPKFFLPHEVVHWAPIPDPLAHFRGQSWIQPVLTEVIGDRAMTTHKTMFFENGTTPNLVISMDTGKMNRQTFKEWIDTFENEHAGAINAYKNLYLGHGASATVVGTNLKDLDYATVQGHGEPLALTTRIPTPTGWTTMADVQPGDEVFGSGPDPIRVTHVLPVHEGRPCFRVVMSDGTSVVADEGHVWSVVDRKKTRKLRDITTREIYEGLQEWGHRHSHRYGLPSGDPVRLPEVDLLVDPYVLGCWLGDGATAGAAICGLDEDLAFIQAQFDQRGYTTRRWSTSPDKVPVFGVPGGLLAALDALGVLRAKRIPDEYLRASIEQRLELLRGLMDTDGTIGHVGNETCEFSSKHEHLALQVAELLRSLGYRASLNFKEDRRSTTVGTWRLTFRADPDRNPFKLPRKADRCRTPLHVKNRTIVAVEPVESVPVRCIAVDSKDRLFRAGEGWVLTHNTRLAAAARVPPIVVGFSEGLEASTYSNYQQAVRAFADGTLRPLWRNMAGSLATVIDVPGGAELWYDDRDIPFLQSDAQDRAEEQVTKATAIRLLVDAGYEPDSVVAAVESNDFSQLTHSGLYSVQLQPPGQQHVMGVDQIEVPAAQQQLAPGQRPQGQLPSNGQTRNGSGKQESRSFSSVVRDAIMSGQVNNVDALAQALRAAKAGNEN